ncbi:type I restriction-modification system subunit M [Bacillus sp. B1-WWTP-T-0.5-Post-4]|uniref:type I restriction-modification system subunit M n=1 Tax=Bacillus sp. B1-WWTP-T-0.5-Post-4 TaxID=2653219 RepID=UPI001262213C|nr:type I restriction-modification system subunit M [Bacillus sp. B1-WWTP-T-0.5-Post-4]KAB7676421.1 N-6 DNA methylase [Bacillus sp. B1-WWTP-T-0.5-Post-4]
MLQNNLVLKQKVDKLWKKFWSNGISNPLTAIEQITYLLFIKRIDDLDLENKNKAQSSGEYYKSKFEGKFMVPGTKEEIDKETLRWSYFKGMNSEDLIPHINTKVFPFLKSLSVETAPFAKHMKNAVFAISKPKLLEETIQIIEEIFEEIKKDSIERNQSFQDIQGDVYELLINEISSSGKNGQFRTPRHIIKLINELLEPEIGNKIADPACGSGGFLLGAYQYIATKLDKNKDTVIQDEDGFYRSSVSGLLSEDIKNILGKSLYGYDIDITMVRLGLMNLMMHGIDNPNIDYKDTLSEAYNEENKYDIIMANPPFTGSVDQSDINSKLKVKTTKTELLFIERIYNMLRVGGSAGVIVPQGVLFSTGKAFVAIRKMLLEKTELKAIINMPSGVFKPYAGVSTAILIFTKGGQTEHVWFYDMQSDGYTLDDKRMKESGYGDLQDIVSKYHQKSEKKKNSRTDKSFLVAKNEIKDLGYDFSISRYKEEEIVDDTYEEPKDIIFDIEKLEKEIEEKLIELRSIFDEMD